MQGFTESWLREHQAKSRAPVPTKGPLQFVLRQPLKLLNELLRMHHRQRSAYTRRLSTEVAGATAHRAGEPLVRKARVTIERHSIGTPDPDGLVASAKGLLDVLQPRSDRHPHGLGLIWQDSPAHLELIIWHIHAPTRAAQRTVVRIEAA